MAHWDLFRPDDSAYEARLETARLEGHTELPEPVLVPRRLMLEVLRLARAHALPLLSQLPEQPGQAWSYGEAQLSDLQQEWVALLDQVSEPRVEEAMDMLLALVSHAQTEGCGWTLWVRAL